jgi:tetratricopeptide (TPR) repeat protein
MKHFWLLLLLFCCSPELSAQNKDSLWQVWSDVEQLDSNRLNAVLTLGKLTIRSKPDSSYQLGIMAADLAEKSKNKKKLGEAKTLQGTALYLQGDYNIALYQLEAALTLHEKHKNKSQIAFTLNTMAALYRELGRPRKTLEIFQRSLELRKEIGDSSGIASSLNNIGIIYRDLNEHESASEFFHKSVELRKKLNDLKGLGSGYTNLGNLAMDAGDTETAIDYYERGLAIVKETGDKYGLAVCLNNLGNVHHQLGEVEKAQSFYLRSLFARESIDDKKGISSSLTSLARVYHEQGKTEDAIKFATNALEIAKEIGAVRKQGAAADILYQAHKELGNFEDAVAMFILNDRISDSLNNSSVQKELIEKRNQFNFNEKMLTDSIQTVQRKRLKQLQLDTQKAKRKEIQQATALQKQLAFYLYVGLALLILAALYLTTRFRKTSRQKTVIETQSEQIVESINYSKKIQEALLPPVEEMSNAIGKFFVYYKPKNIVGGDFYWYKTLNNCSVFACIDCSGHGVAGGFISTLGSLLLDKIVSEDSNDPEKILNQLSEELSYILQHTGESRIQSEIQFTICIIDLKGKSITCSSTGNGVLLVRDGTIQMSHNNPKREVRTESIALQQSDWVFLYTNGFLNQPGGNAGLSMEQPVFEKHLAALTKLDSNESAEQYLQTTFEQWMKEREQQDDILISGFQMTVS